MRFSIPLFFLCALAGAAPVNQPPKLRLPAGAQPSSYAVDLTIVPGQDTFRGAVDIALDMRAPAQVVWLNATALEIQDATFQPAAGPALHPQVIAGSDQFAGFSFDKPLSGSGVLHIAYTGKISKNSSAGVFQMQEAGRWYAYTQFEPTDARRAFPCFDEPGFKVPWQLTLHVPKINGAFANTPMLSETDEPGGMKMVQFQESKPLPSYLVAFAVGPFEVVDAGKVGKTPLRIIVPNGKSEGAKFAAEAIPQLLKLLEEYFGTPFPYEKLDSVVMPISNFAMENAGLITYGETLLLARPGEDTINRQRQMAIVAAHEMAHQWFGDLVTTAWWNDTWLNEAFASWMERKITGQWKPDWRLEVSGVNARMGAMRRDTLVNARKVRQPIESNNDIANAFDDITYEKGAAVIAMFENWIGKDKFRKGIQLYMKQHAWGSATAADFEAAISTAAGRNIAPAFDSFLDQAGVPEVSVKLDCTAKPKLELSQKRLLPIGSKGSASQLWSIPVCVAYESGGAAHHQCELLTDPRSTMTLSAAKTCPAWILPNDGEVGYYEAGYTPELLQKTLAEKGSHLTVAERVGVLGNVRMLVSAGDLSPRIALALVPEFSSDPDREVVSAAEEIARILIGAQVPAGLRPNAARFIREVFGKRAEELGWTPKPGESSDTRLLRQSLVPFVAGSGEDPVLIDEAKKLADRWLQDRSGISPDLVPGVLRIAAEFGDQAFWDRLRQALAKERNQRVRERLLSALGSFRDPQLAKESMSLLLAPDVDYRESFYALLLGPLASPQTQQLPFEFVTQNIDQLIARLPREVGGDYAAMLPVTGQGFCDVTHRDEVEAFFRDRVKDYTGGPRTLAQTLESIDLCTARREKLGPELSAFLQSH